MVRVCRFSATNFLPQTQTHLLQEIEYLNVGDFSQIPQHLRRFVEDSRSEINPHWNEQCEGFWVFVGGVEEQDKEEVRFQLNHMTSVAKQQCQWHETALSEQTLAYPAHSALRGSPKPLSSFATGDPVYIFKQTF